AGRSEKKRSAASASWHGSMLAEASAEFGKVVSRVVIVSLLGSPSGRTRPGGAGRGGGAAPGARDGPRQLRRSTVGAEPRSRGRREGAPRGRRPAPARFRISITEATPFPVRASRSPGSRLWTIDECDSTPVRRNAKLFFDLRFQFPRVSDP